MTAPFRNVRFGSSVIPAAWSSIITSPGYPTDATQETAAITPGGTPAYTDVALGTSGVIYQFSGGTAKDASLVQGGNNPLLAGSVTMGAGNWYYQTGLIGLGRYNIRAAFGYAPGASSNQLTFIIEGTLARFLSDCGSTQTAINGFNSGAGVSNSPYQYPVAVADGSVWMVTSASGTTGTTPPSIAASSGGVFTDNGVTWKRCPRNVLAYISGAPPVNYVVDQNGAITAASAWGTTTPLSVTVSGTYGPYLTVCRANAATGYGTPSIRAVQIQQQSLPLVDAISADDLTGVSTGTTPAVFAMEPAGIRAFRLSAPQGAFTPATVSFGGPCGASFTPKFYDLQLWAETTGVPLPDSLATGSTAARTLTVIHNDPAATGGPHTTTMVLSVTSSKGKPTDSTVFGLCSTRGYLGYRTVADQWTTDGWHPPANPTLTTDYVATSGIDFANAYTGIAADNTFHRIRIGPGVFEAFSALGVYGLPAGTQNGSFNTTKDWGVNGGMIIEDASGAPLTPFNIALIGNVRGLYVRNLLTPGDARKTYGTALANSSNSQFSFYAGSTYLSRFRLENIQAGLLASPALGYAQVDVDGNYKMVGGGNLKTNPTGTPLRDTNGYLITDQVWATSLLYTGGTESGEVINCTGLGHVYGTGIGSTRIIKLTNNTWGYVSGDSHDFRPIGSFAATRLTDYGFANNDCYVLEEGTQYVGNIDYPGYQSAVHSDNFQITRMDGLQTSSGNHYGIFTRDAYTPTPGYSNYKALVGNQALSMHSVPPALYEVVSIQTGPLGEAAGHGALGGPPPTGHGSGIVDGGITWKWVADYNFQGTSHIAWVGNTGDTSAPLSGKDDRQWFIDSSGIFPVEFVALDCLYASNTDKGFAGGSINAIIEYCTNPSTAIESGTTMLQQYHRVGSLQLGGGSMRARKNRMAGASGAANSSGAPHLSYDEDIIDFTNSAPTTTAPSSKFTGPIEPGSYRYTMPTFATSPLSFKDKMRTMFGSLDPSVQIGALPSIPPPPPPPPVTPVLSVTVESPPYNIGVGVDFVVLPSSATSAFTATGASDHAGSWTSATLPIPAGTAGVTFTFIPGEVGPHSITFTNSAGLANPAPLVLVVSYASVPWAEGDPIYTDHGGALLVYGKRSVGVPLTHRGPAIDAGYIKPNNADPKLVTAPVKGPHTPTVGSEISWQTVQPNAQGGGNIVTNFVRRVVA